MSAWVLLRHELPDRSWHYDWLIEPPGTEGLSVARTLISFRIGPDVEWPPTSPFAAARIGPHRREYLSYEGPISGGRGRVERVASGECRIVDISDGELSVAIAFGRSILLNGRAVGPPGPETPWWFDLESA